MAFDRQIQANCLSRCWEVDQLSIVITPVDLIFFEDMSEEDRDFHKNLIRAGIRAAWQNRINSSRVLRPDTPHIKEGND